MSATNRSDVRVPQDVYETPAWCVHRLLDAGALPLPSCPATLRATWFDPCAGGGAIIRAVNDWQRTRCPYVPCWSAVEIRPECRAALEEAGAEVAAQDFLAAPAPRADVVITNPPYSLAREFIDRCIVARVPTVAMLLRLNFLGSEARRADFERWGVPDVYVLPNRPSFTGGGTDATEYAWFVWRRPGHPYGRLEILALTPRAERCGAATPGRGPSTPARSGRVQGPAEAQPATLPARRA